MALSILQLNINADNFWDDLIPFLANHDFDIIQLQEVCGKDSISGNINSKRDCLEELRKVLAEKYNGELAIAERFTSSPSSYIGNATFYKKDFTLLEKNVVILQPPHMAFPSDATNYGDEGRVLLHLKLEIQGQIVSFLNTHFTWASTSKEEPHQTKPGEILLQYLQQIKPPFVFTGDLNLDPDQPIIQDINKLARNLTHEHKVTNTLNPHTHRAKAIFPQGIAVDYIFVSQEIEVKQFSILEEDLSDHLALTAEINI